MNLILYDLETNGTSTAYDRILEVYAVRLMNNKSKGLHRYVQIEDNNVDLYAFHKNGWTEEFLNKNGRPMQEVMVDLFRLFTEHPEPLLCGYFIRTFDNLFLKKMQRRYGLPDFDWEANTFDIALEYKAVLSGLYDRFPRSNWRLVHEMVLRNDYSSYVKKSGYGMRTEECCRYYGIPVDAKKQHNATYDTTLCHNVLKKQRPEWFGI